MMLLVGVICHFVAKLLYLGIKNERVHFILPSIFRNFAGGEEKSISIERKDDIVEF